MAPRISRVEDIETRFGAKTDFENVQRVFELSTPEAYPSDRESCFKEAWAAYAGPDRKYHNTAHLASLYRDLAPVLECSPPVHDIESRACWLSLLYHDVIYQGNTGGMDEAMSCAYVRRHAVRLKLPPRVIDATIMLIGHTAAHFARPVDLPRGAHLFLDADLAVLATDAKIFIRQEQLIRQEYPHVPDDVWKRGRISFCQRALTSARIFHTRYFGADREWSARTNMVETIKRLSV